MRGRRRMNRTIVYDGPGHVLRLPWGDMARGVPFDTDRQTAEWLLNHPRVNVSEQQPEADSGEGHDNHEKEEHDGGTT